MSLSPGEIIDDKYRIVRLIGEGGMGAVYEGENARIHRRVAIKVLHAEVAANGDAVARFEREAQAAGRIGSEHIVEVLDLGTMPSGARYLVMEFMDGDSLSKRIKQRGKLSPQELYPIVRQLLEALIAAHGAGIVHRDLKPDNIFLLASRHGGPEFLKLLDFGISKFSDLHGAISSMTRTGAVMGTPYYMAPEQAKGSRQLDHRVDLYAVGVVMYEALTGKVPFDAETFNELLFKIVLETPRPIEELAPGMDPNLCAIVRRAMAREPNERFQTAAEFRGALDQWWASGAGPSLPDASGRYSQVNPNVRPSAPHFNMTPGNWTDVPPGLEVAATRNRKPLYIATAAIVLVVFGAGGFLLISGRESNREAAEAAASAAASASSLPVSAPTSAASVTPSVAPSASEAATVRIGEPSLANGALVGAVTPSVSAPPPSVRPPAPPARPARRPQATQPAQPAPQRAPEPPPPTTTKTNKSGRPIRTEL